DDLVRPDSVLLLLRVAKSGVVDAPGDVPDEAPLDDAPAYGCDRVLRIRIEVEAEPLAALAVAGAPKLERELQRLHECRRADHVVVVERAPTRVRVLVPEQAL